MGRSRGPPRPSGEDKKTHPDLFAWAETAAAKLGRSRDDVAAAAMAGLPTILSILSGIWSRASAESALPLALAATVPLIVLCFVVYGVRAFRERIRSPGTSIFLQGGSLIVAALGLFLCVGLLVKVELDQHAVTREQFAREREAERKQRAEQEEFAKNAKDAATRETECLIKWTAAVKTTQRRQQNAKAKLEECRTAYSQNFLPFYTFEATCRSSLTEVELADRAHASSLRRVCSTGSIK